MAKVCSYACSGSLDTQHQALQQEQEQVGIRQVRVLEGEDAIGREPADASVLALEVHGAVGDGELVQVQFLGAARLRSAFMRNSITPGPTRT